MNRSNNKSCTDAGSDEVEQMLREAEDAMLLKLSVNSHMARDASSDLPPDLAQRFQSLKSGSSTSKSTKPMVVVPKVREEQASVTVEDHGDDLLARFDALKASLPKPSATASSVSGLGVFKEEVKVGGDGDSGGECEDEVDKIIRWAVDAARLDPSPESDGDVGEDDEIESDSSNGDSDDEDYQKRKKDKQGTKKR